MWVRLNGSCSCLLLSNFSYLICPTGRKRVVISWQNDGALYGSWYSGIGSDEWTAVLTVLSCVINVRVRHESRWEWKLRALVEYIACTFHVLLLYINFRRTSAICFRDSCWKTSFEVSLTDFHTYEAWKTDNYVISPTDSLNVGFESGVKEL